MNPKLVTCIILIYFLNELQVVTSSPAENPGKAKNATCDTCDSPWFRVFRVPLQISDVKGSRSTAPKIRIPNTLGKIINAQHTFKLIPIPIPPQTTERSTSLVTEQDSNLYYKGPVCMDHFFITPRTDGLPGSRTIAKMPNLGGNLVVLRCLWPIAVAWDSAIKIFVEIHKSDWHLPCTAWNLSLEYGLDPVKPRTHMTVVCPRERSTMVEIPPEAKRAVAILTGLITRTPGLSLRWEYLNVPPLPATDFPIPVEEMSWEQTTWGQLAIISGSFGGFIVFFFGLCLCWELRKRRRGRRTGRIQRHVEIETIELSVVPPRPRLSMIARVMAKPIQLDQLPLLAIPVETPVLTPQQSPLCETEF